MDIKNRTIAEANYILETGCTIRECACVFGAAKSTVHSDVTVRLLQYDYEKWTRVSKILKYNDSVKHIRGGDSTRRLYKGKAISLPCPTDCTPRDA